ncbi:MAG TPA: oxidoreductase [Alcanivorax sp.]|jgi:nitroreductase|uniref:nitroreductase n=1 Tax=Alloalcanivorax venustensis TaxID=172371 RepID=UPI000E7F13CB|nr:nitroreductase [Alcanivorax sp.]MCH9784120.1 nitroreductase [Gammaproteobacteria bacterium]MCH2551748.1 nitroreductase [Alcanivorax sp.]HAB04613.1 oxidoreductase [Alcanivorax sp.]HBS13692.1 oxidoreductase [Alcanivorax sp.]|tara:strand:- start:917 stop:1603 length:687 start_codon:yes stop_codon:yes gene_type:complete
MSAETQSLADALRSRRSVRGFLDKPVPEETLKAIFELAQLAPSNCNIQPWKVFVASGEVRDELRRRMVEKVTAGVPMEPDFEPNAGKFSGVYRQRQVDCAVELYNNMGIARDDKPGRMRAQLRNFELFDAPHVVFIGMEREFGPTVALDVGMYIQSLMLAMTAHGVGSCAQGSMRYFPNDVREIFGEPASTAILVGISFGYEDPDVAANRTRVGRAPLADSVAFKAAL